MYIDLKKNKTSNKSLTNTQHCRRDSSLGRGWKSNMWKMFVMSFCIVLEAFRNNSDEDGIKTLTYRTENSTWIKAKGIKYSKTKKVLLRSSVFWCKFKRKKNKKNRVSSKNPLKSQICLHYVLTQRLHKTLWLGNCRGCFQHNTELMYHWRM